MSETITHIAIWDAAPKSEHDLDIDWDEVEVFDLISWYDDLGTEGED
jgi:hypothetical protein